MKGKKFMVLVLAVAGTLMMNLNVSAKNSYRAVVKETRIDWLGKKLVGEHFGTVQLSSGTLDYNGTNIKGGHFVVDMTSIICKDLEDEGYRKKLEGHLKSDDFFGVEKFPTASFLISQSQKQKDGSFLVKGEATIKGVTHPIDFRVVLSSQKEGLKAKAKIVIDRTQYGVRYGSGSFFSNLGDKTINDEFELTVDMLLQE